MNAQDVVQQAHNANLRLVRFLYCDNGGIIRGKATHASKLATRISEGIGQTLAMQAFTGVESLAAVEGMGPIGEFRLIPDPQTFVILPYVPNTGSMMCDMIRLDGQPWEACPRTFLKRMAARLAEQGMREKGESPLPPGVCSHRWSGPTYCRATSAIGSTRRPGSRAPSAGSNRHR